ncbi:MAG: LysM peptidoglycan-binding domain-containing protein [Spirochaetaceae bacterium]|jgi:hypothetical protein|nr:LysM peptidoglycan-binding domain-containing protein [Spirochaetaceae bacterium]
MKNIIVLLVGVLTVLNGFSCATNNSAQENLIPQDELNALFNNVYDKYQSDVILDGAQSYVVVKGDTMTKISAKYYGSGYEYLFPMIMVSSRDVIVDPSLIEPGMNLTIPDLAKNLVPKNRMQIAYILTGFADIYSKKGDSRTYDRFMRLAMKLAAY